MGRLGIHLEENTGEVNLTHTHNGWLPIVTAFSSRVLLSSS